MSISNEWWEYHLTNDGWIDGDYKLETIYQVTIPPQSRVLTIRKTEVMGYNYSRIETDWTETYRHEDDVLVNRLIDQYGMRDFK